MTDPTAALATTLREERTRRAWSVAELAQRSSVSRAMISRVERGEASPTATLLGRLSGAFGLTLSQLLARSEDTGRHVARAGEQPSWRDPATGYVRRALSPPAGGPLELVEVALPAGAVVGYPADTYTFIRQQVWVLEGTLTLLEGDAELRLHAGDCVAFGPPVERRFAAPDGAVRYLVAVVR